MSRPSNDSQQLEIEAIMNSTISTTSQATTISIFDTETDGMPPEEEQTISSLPPTSKKSSRSKRKDQTESELEQFRRVRPEPECWDKVVSTFWGKRCCELMMLVVILLVLVLIGFHIYHCFIVGTCFLSRTKKGRQGPHPRKY
ncbi:unnamed protein product [Orchesella dallaii]|uniref:Uncharacterized protein n=1 Tax=Orchesella dallaii TaxID=48710 RepID=A0ABP1PSC2_9HEXA